MAKPKPSSSSPSLATSKTFSKPKANRKGHPHGSRRRPLNSSPVPSSGLLAFLAGLTASSSSAYGHPVDTQVLPPDFLCPGLGSDQPSAAPLTPQPSSSRRAERRDDPDRPRPSQRHITKRDSKRPFVPPKYIQGQDGRWRKIANWTLYGYCNCEEDSSTEYATLPVAENDIEATSASILPPDSLPTPSIMEDQLPPGWKSESESNHVLTYIILVLSLILAVLICIFMVGCIAWRKKRKERRDLEKTASSSSLRLGYDSDEENEEIKQAKKQQKLWAKASARWKANVRISARRRRAQRNILSGSSLARASRTSLASSTTSASSSSVEAPMRSVVDVSNASFPSNPLDHENQPDNDTQLPSSSASIVEAPPPAGPVSSRPPSYLRNSQPCLPSHHSNISERLTPESVREPISELSSSRKTLDTDHTDPDHTSRDEPPPSPYEETSLDVAHVATDDKNVLARMAAMASAPPVADENDSSHSGNSSGPSVPILEFEHDVYEDHPDHSPSGPSSDPAHLPQLLPSLPSHDELSLSPPAPSYSSNPHDASTQHPLFPAPPSKGVLAAPSFYEYPASFEEDILNAEPSSEPSAPPFELEQGVPSAPSVDGVDGLVMGDKGLSLVPSAPPALDMHNDTVPDDQEHGHVCASAPSMEDMDAVEEQPGSSSRTSGIARSVDLPGYLP